MADIKYQGEKHLSDIVARAFGNLLPRDAKRAEAALLEANPPLRQLRRLKRGTVLHVPALAELDAAATSGELSQLGDRVATAGEALRDFQVRLAESADAATKAAKDVAAQLKSRELQRLVVRFKLQPLVAAIEKANEQRAALAKEAAVFSKETIATIGKDLQGLAEKLR